MTAYYNEIDPKAAAWLRELVARGLIAPGVVDERDIRDIRPADLHGFTQCHFFAGIGVWSYALRRAGWPDDRAVWTGSCPCQPFSAAGKGGGFDDERHLWPAFHWLIAQCRPGVVFGEQVASKDAEPWLDLVQADLEGLDYAFGACAFPSAGIGAPHIRDRTYWVADAAGRGLGKFGGSVVEGRVRYADRGEFVGGMADAICQRRRLGQSGSEDATDAALAVEAGGLAFADGGHPGAERQQRGREQRQQPQDGGAGGLVDSTGDRHTERNLGDKENPQRSTSSNEPIVFQNEGSGRANPPDAGELVRPAGPVNGLWRDADWLFCRDGKWRPVEPGTFPLAHGAPARVGRLRGYGNAINAEAARVFIEAYLG